MAAGTLHQSIEQGDQAFSALQGKAFLSHVLGMQVTLQTFRRRDAVQQAPLRLRRILRITARALQPLLQPAFFRGVGDVHILGAEMAAVGAREDVEDLAQRGFLRADQGAGIEHAIQIRRGQSVVVEVEVGHAGGFFRLQRVDRGPLVTAKTIGVDQLQYPHLFQRQLHIAAAGDHGCARCVQRLLTEAVQNEGVRHILGAVDPRQAIARRIWVVQNAGREIVERSPITLVEFFQVGGVAPRQQRGPPLGRHSFIIVVAEFVHKLLSIRPGRAGYRRRSRACVE